MFEYQTAISELTGLPVSNATLYEGAAAVAAGGLAGAAAQRRGRFLVSRGLHPHSREALRRPPRATARRVEEIGLSAAV